MAGGAKYPRILGGGAKYPRIWDGVPNILQPDGGSSFPEGVLDFLGKIAWSCQISGGANSSVTPDCHASYAVVSKQLVKRQVSSSNSECITYQEETFEGTYIYLQWKALTSYFTQHSTILLLIFL